MAKLFITGANRGLGFEFVRQYAAEGWEIIACCREPEKATELKALTNKFPAIIIEKLDVTDFDAVRALAKKYANARIDVLINNAGILSGTSGVSGWQESGPEASQIYPHIDPVAWQKVLLANTISPIMIAQAFAPTLPAGSKIAFITSRMASIQEMGPTYIAYRTSKAALNAGMRNLSFDLDKLGIISVCLSPGWVKTSMGGPGASLTPTESIQGMRKVIAGLRSSDNGTFLDHEGKKVAW